MKKYGIAAVLLAATIGTNAQTPNENWIARFPSMPSANALLSYDKDQRNPDGPKQNPLLPDLIETVDKVLDQIDEIIATSEEEATLAEEEALKQKLEGSGVSLSQFDKMTKGEQEALLRKQNGGLSDEDVRRLEEMSDDERAQYMNARGVDVAVKQKIEKQIQLKKKIDTHLAYKLEETAFVAGQTHQQSLSLITLKDALNYGDSLWMRKYAPNYRRLVEEKGYLQEQMEKNLSAADVTALQAKIRGNNKQIFDLENLFYAEYLPKYVRAVQSALEYIRETEIPAYRDWISAYEEAYKLTGDPRWKLRDAQTILPVEAYGRLLRSVERYDHNPYGQIFQTAGLDK